MPHIWKDKEKTKLGFKPDWKPGILWGQELGKPECPYLKRWVFNFGLFAIRLHRWYSSDDPRYMHDHPWGFWTLVLKGGYYDVTKCDKCNGTGKDYLDHSDHYINGFGNCGNCGGTSKLYEKLTKGSFKYRPPNHLHTVQTLPGGATTLIFNGPHRRKWGFWVEGRFVGVRKYFKKFGHHPCEN